MNQISQQELDELKMAQTRIELGSEAACVGLFLWGIFLIGLCVISGYTLFRVLGG